MKTRYWLIMFGALMLLAGCQTSRPLSEGRRPQPVDIRHPLSEKQLCELVRAANDLAMFGTPVPEHVPQEIKPVEIYPDLANVVVALSRGTHSEQGYYIVTPFSSFLPAGHFRGFSWEHVDTSRLPGIYQEIYVYRRTR